MEIVNGILIPVIKITFIGGIIAGCLFFVGKGFFNAWSKSWKFIYEYKFRKTPYPEETVKWVYDCIENKVDRYQVKKKLCVSNVKDSIINEVMWIYDQISMEIYKEQNGGKINGREFKRSYSKNESSANQLPTFTKE